MPRDLNGPARRAGSSVRFTILLPTTGDRGPLLPFVIDRVRQQTIEDWELIVVGDGVDASTRRVILEMCAQDARIRFLDRPKHERRGEVYRHEALASARGELVAYVTDRDLWFPDHLKTLAAALADRDFAHTLAMCVEQDGTIVYGLRCNLEERVDRDAMSFTCRFALSSVGHTLAAYRRLPAGWRTTPAGIKTDQYMWMQLLSDRACTVRSLDVPTVLYFRRGDHPGMPTPERHAELEAWSRKLPDAASQRAFREETKRSLARPLPRLRRAAMSYLVYRPRAARLYQSARGVMKRIGLP
jgi:glycosyltransferase involved in cell wall biosynthesis